jgi:hypothetical protein
MKKVSMLLLTMMILSKSFSQNIGINATGATPHPSAMLDVNSTTKGMLIPRLTSAQRVAIASPATGLFVYDTDNNSFWVYNGATLGWAQLNYWTNTSFNSTDVYNTNTGNVGIGTNSPFTKLNIKTATNAYGVTQTDGTITVGTYIGAGEGWIGTRSNHPLVFFTNDGGQAMTLATNGNLGIGNNSPLNRLQIGNSQYSGYDFQIADRAGTANGLAFLVNSSSTIIDATKNILFFPTSSHSLGINTSSAANTLQIGSMGAIGFNGNDLAFGNGTNATGLSQNNSFMQVASSTDIALMPRANGHGRVGINTTTPRAPLDVMDAVTVGISNVYDGYAYYSIQFSGGVASSNIGGIDAVSDPASIVTSGRILATEFDAYSDARIKSVTGVSNSQKDLETINSIRITDYTMKDKVKYGNRCFKKVIAQEVEKVYPQVVSKHADFIPNVYQLTSKIQNTDSGYLVSFSSKHNITKDAKKLRVLYKNSKEMEEMDIISVPSDYQVLIKGHVTGNQFFVYGEEVDDFRTVDYEGLTTLNISATQQLSRLLEEQNKRIEVMENEIRLLKNKKAETLPASYSFQAAKTSN